MIVAIDGPAGSGKSTTAREVARRLGYLYLNTGAMYRGVALAFLKTGSDASPDAADALLPELRLDLRYDGGDMRILLNDEDVTRAIRQPEVGQMASRVGKLAAVRQKLVAEQRRLGTHYGQDPGVVLEGRDIGTVVFPDAEVKIFLIAEPEVRARRRQAELAAAGTSVAFETVLAEIQQRDRQDRQRALSPLRKADDAVELDTSDRSIDEQVAFVIDCVRERENARTV